MVSSREKAIESVIENKNDSQAKDGNVDDELIERAKFAKKLGKKLQKLSPSIILLASNNNENKDQSIMSVKYLNDE